VRRFLSNYFDLLLVSLSIALVLITASKCAVFKFHTASCLSLTNYSIMPTNHIAQRCFFFLISMYLRYFFEIIRLLVSLLIPNLLGTPWLVKWHVCTIPVAASWGWNGLLALVRIHWSSSDSSWRHPYRDYSSDDHCLLPVLISSFLTRLSLSMCSLGVKCPRCSLFSRKLLRYVQFMEWAVRLSTVCNVVAP